MDGLNFNINGTNGISNGVNNGTNENNIVEEQDEIEADDGSPSSGQFSSVQSFIEFIFAVLIAFSVVRLYDNIVFNYFGLSSKSLKVSIILLISIIALLFIYLLIVKLF